MLSNEYIRLRLGRHISRKGNKFGLWVLEQPADNASSSPPPSSPLPTPTEGIIVAHYYVQGELGSAKVRLLSIQAELMNLQIVFQIENHVHYGQRLILLIAEFSNSDTFVIFELDEKSQLPAM